jgi:hypothetical protein
MFSKGENEMTQFPNKRTKKGKFSFCFVLAKIK